MLFMCWRMLFICTRTAFVLTISHISWHNFHTHGHLSHHFTSASNLQHRKLVCSLSHLCTSIPTCGHSPIVVFVNQTVGNRSQMLQGKCSRSLILPTLFSELTKLYVEWHVLQYYGLDIFFKLNPEASLELRSMIQHSHCHISNGD